MTSPSAPDEFHGRVRARLRSLEILKGVDEEIAWGVLQHCGMRQLAVGDVLLAKGQSNRVMYFVLEGRLGIHLADDSAPPMAFLEQGQTVGELSVMDGSPASAHVIALEPVLLLEVVDETFWRLANASHQFAINLLLLLAHRMRNNISSLQRAAVIQHQLERDATVDALTGLHNRRWWDDKFHRVLGRCNRDQSSMSLLVIDVDRFKNYNDSHGHACGDQVLRIVASTLAKNVRPTDIVARYGGEEFVALLPATDLAGGMTAADRLRQAVARASIGMCEGRELPSVTISIGVASLHIHDDSSTLFHRADAALYVAKSNGRNQCAAESTVTITGECDTQGG